MKLNFTLLVLIITTTVSQLMGQIVTDGLQSYYDFNSNFTLDILDSSGNDFNGDGNFLTQIIGIEDTENTAYEFNGTESFIDAGINDRNISNKVSMSVWIKTTSLKNQAVISKYDWTEDKGYLIRLNNGFASIAGRDNGGDFVEIASTLPINDGEWHHIVGTIDKNKWNLFVDNQLVNEIVTSTTNPLFTNTTFLSIGALSISGGSNDLRFFEGAIDEVRIYDRCLSGIEVDSLFNEDFSTTSNSNVLLDQQIKFYPNPTNDVLNIDLEKPHDFQIIIYDSYGRKILEENNPNQINVSTLSKGFYFLHLRDKSRSSKVITQKIKIE